MWLGQTSLLEPTGNARIKLGFLDTADHWARNVTVCGYGGMATWYVWKIIANIKHLVYSQRALPLFSK